MGLTQERIKQKAMCLFESHGCLTVLHLHMHRGSLSALKGQLDRKMLLQIWHFPQKAPV